MRWLRVEPVDVFCGRGNKLFGEAGSFGGVAMPPWPSVFAGALRSKIMTDSGTDPRDLLLGKLTGNLARVLGKGISTGKTLPDGNQEFVVLPGDFRLVWVSLQMEGEVLTPIPSDMVLQEHGKEGPQFLRPSALPEGVRTSIPTTQTPVFKSMGSSKLETGYWMGKGALRSYLKGETPRPEQLLPVSRVWTTEERVGIGMDPFARTVETGKLFTTEAVRLLHDITFLVGVQGADEVLSAFGLSRLGGDGRGAIIRAAEPSDPRYEVDLEEVARSGRFRLILSSPGLFPNGWLPFGVRPDSLELEWSLDGLKMSAKLVAAATRSFETVSGWDLAREQPKPAQRLVPAWSVYWFDEACGSVKEILERILSGGLWETAKSLWDTGSDDHSAILWRERRAEGFNNVLIGLWPKE